MSHPYARLALVLFALAFGCERDPSMEEMLLFAGDDYRAQAGRILTEYCSAKSDPNFITSWITAGSREERNADRLAGNLVRSIERLACPEHGCTLLSADFTMDRAVFEAAFYPNGLPRMDNPDLGFGLGLPMVETSVDTYAKSVRTTDAITTSLLVIGTGAMICAPVALWLIRRKTRPFAA